ncbi:MAG: PAS domain S-box protein [Pseudomonadota bacterium]
MDTPNLSFLEYRLLVEQAPIMIWRANQQAKCDYFNQRWLAFTGRGMAEELGDGWAQGVHADDLARCLSIYIEAFQRREIFEMTYRLRRHDGQYRWILDRGVPFTDSQGQFAGYIGSCQDITERVQAEELLAKSNDKQMRQLMGLLSICSKCKRIRNEQGSWQKLEAYIEAHSRAAFSHGLCPDCAQELYPELAQDPEAAFGGGEEARDGS